MVHCHPTNQVNPQIFISGRKVKGGASQKKAPPYESSGRYGYLFVLFSKSSHQAGTQASSLVFHKPSGLPFGESGGDHVSSCRTIFSL